MKRVSRKSLNFQTQQKSAVGMQYQMSTEDREHCFEKYTFMHLKNEDSQTHLNVKTKFGYNTQIIKNSNIAKHFLYHCLQKYMQLTSKDKNLNPLLKLQTSKYLPFTETGLFCFLHKSYTWQIEIAFSKCFENSLETKINYFVFNIYL